MQYLKCLFLASHTMDAAGEILGKRACQDHPSARLRHHLVSQNICLKEAAPQKAVSMGHFKLVRSPKRKSYTDPVGGCSTRRQQPRVLVSQTEVFRLSHCLSMYTDPALASLNSTLHEIPLLPLPSRRTLPLCFFVSGAK